MECKKCDIQVKGFTKEYPKVNLELKNEDEMNFDLSIIYIYLSELENGFAVNRVYKTYKKGTKVSYKPIDNDNVKEITDIINGNIDDFNKKYKVNLPHVKYKKEK